MPGYLAQPSSNASEIFNAPAGNISATNVQEAVNELDSEKANASSVASALTLKANIESPTFTGTTTSNNHVITGNLTVDTNTLFVDSTNNRVGIATTSPTVPLHSNGEAFISGLLTIGRTNASDEGGEIRLCRSTDNAAYWTIDTFGSTSSPNLRIFNEGVVKLSIDSSGRVNTPNQPAFRYHGFAINASGMQGGSAPLNIGSHLSIFPVGNASFSRFTAPVAGVYMFGFSVLIDQNGGRVEAVMRKNGGSTIDGIPFWAANDFANASNAFTNAVNTYVVSLAANDFIDWILMSGTTWSDLNRGDRQFWGILLG